MKAIPSFVVAFSAAVALLAPPARAQQGTVIQKIIFVSNTPDGRPPVPAATLLAQMQTKVGQPLDPATLRQDLTKLNNPDTGYLRQQGYYPYLNRYHPYLDYQFAAGVLTVPVYESLIAQIEITGNHKVATEDILRKMQSKAGAPLSDKTLQADMERLKKTGDFVSVGPPQIDTSDRQIEVTIPVVERPGLTVAGDATEQPRAGEVWLEGTVRDMDLSQKRLDLLVLRTQSPDQSPQDTGTLRPQAVLVRPTTTLRPPTGGSAGVRPTLNAFQPGDTVIIIGKAPAPGKPLVARMVAAP